MKNKIINVVFKKFQSYSFIIFLVLVLAAFFALAQLNNRNQDLPNNDDVPTGTDDDTNPPQNPVVKLEDEKFILPVDSSKNPVKARDFWNFDGSTEDQEKALIKYENTFFANEGVNYTLDNETIFEVQASLSGEVTKVQQDPILGYVVEIEHLFNIKTLYTSLEEANVAIGDTVKQGDVIGNAGSNNFDTECGTHVHFEVLQNGINLNPNDLIGIKISELNDE